MDKQGYEQLDRIESKLDELLEVMTVEEEGGEEGGESEETKE